MDSNYVILARHLRECAWNWESSENNITRFTKCRADDVRGEGCKENGEIEISANVNGDIKFLYTTIDAMGRKCNITPVLRLVIPVDDPTKIVTPYLDYSGTPLFYPVDLTRIMLDVISINIDLYKQVIPAKFVWHVPFYFAIHILLMNRRFPKPSSGVESQYYAVEGAIAEIVIRYGEVFKNFTRSINVHTYNVPGDYTLENYVEFTEEISGKTEEWLDKWVKGFIARAPKTLS